jgi:hypothetical protein
MFPFPPPDRVEIAQELTLAMRVASLKLDLVLAEEELRQFRVAKHRRDAE